MFQFVTYQTSSIYSSFTTFRLKDSLILPFCETVKFRFIPHRPVKDSMETPSPDCFIFFFFCGLFILALFGTRKVLRKENMRKIERKSRRKENLEENKK